jgi:hypothetical protein
MWIRTALLHYIRRNGMNLVLLSTMMCLCLHMMCAVAPSLCTTSRVGRTAVDTMRHLRQHNTILTDIF